MPIHEAYMQRCLQLAQLSAGTTAPNPMVGAILVYNDHIIGEGYTQPYGQSHAEVMCINSVAEADQSLIAKATLYVSLEPCAHFGKTPPCTELIIRSRIPNVVIGCTDSFEAVNGKGIAKLEAAGVTIITGILEAACRAINKRFFTFHIQQRPYVVLKWAQSANGMIAATGQRTAISSDANNRLVHRWRSEEMGIMIGGHTALIDNPHLTTRLWKGNNPIRIAVEGRTPLPSSLHLFDETATTLVFTKLQGPQHKGAIYFPIKEGYDIAEILQQLYQQRITSILVEGGSTLLQHFINSGLWDEARIITNTTLHIPEGVIAPSLKHGQLLQQQVLGTDNIQYYSNNQVPNQLIQPIN